MPKEYIYAGFWVRVAALLVDGLIIGLLNSVILFSALGATYYVADYQTFQSEHAILLVTILFVKLAYFTFFTSSVWQATPGKKIVGIKVMNTDGTRISFLKSLGRCTIGYMLSSIIFFVGYIMVAFTPKRTALHDKVFSTYVVYED
jgi:uncharacterized RDD family membrane protein YckC